MPDPSSPRRRPGSLIPGRSPDPSAPDASRRPPVPSGADRALVAERLSWQTPDGVVILADGGLSLGAERVGLVGRNGAGKSTLLRILAGLQRPDSGSIRRDRPTRCLAQELPPPEGRVADALGLGPLLESLAAIEAGSLDPAHYARLDGCWDFREVARRRLAELGLAELALDRPLGTLSGGQQRLLALAAPVVAVNRASTGREPGSLEPIRLLDEPTRHLDIDRRRDLYSWLERLSGPCLIVSHDAGVLDRVDRILELVGGRLVRYGGTRRHFEQRRDEERRAREAAEVAAGSAARKARRELRQSLERQARRAARGRRSRRDGSQPKVVQNARQARSEGTARRLGAAGRRRAERLDRRHVELVERRRARGDLRGLEALPRPELAALDGRTLLAARGLSLSRGGFRLMAAALRVEGTARVGLVGPNGAGKSTLLEAIERAARGADSASGDSQRSSGSEPGLQLRAERLCVMSRVLRVDQRDGVEPGGRGACEESREAGGGMSVMQALARRHPELSSDRRAAIIGRLGYRRGRRRRPFAALSGGERLILRLAAAMASEPAPELLLLDEPSRDLDREARERLVEALADWPGAVILSSHDEGLLARLGLDQLWEIRDGAVAVSRVRG